MKASEFITESISELSADISSTLPSTYTIPKLPNSDTYMQYRFGVAIAAAKGKSQRAKDNIDRNYMSSWGQNQTIISSDPHIDEWIDDALEEIGLSPSDKKLLTTPESEEPKSTSTVSPINGFKGYER
jgi:hypothetical protein